MHETGLRARTVNSAINQLLRIRADPEKRRSLTYHTSFARKP